MRRLTVRFMCCAFLLLSLTLCGGESSIGKAEQFEAGAALEPVENWLPVGEELEYKLYWGVIPVGTAKFTSEWTTEDGRKLIRLRGVAKTGPVLSRIYPVNDFIESLVVPETFLPIRYVQVLKEGRSYRYDTMTFDYEKGKAYWESGVSDDSHEIELDKDSRDILSFAYYARSKGYEVGQEQKFRVLVDDKLYDLEVKGLKIESQKVHKIGKVECLKVEPKAKFGAIFVRKGRVLLWYSTDRRHICVRATAKLKVASVKALLVSAKGPGYDRWQKREKDK